MSSVGLNTGLSALLSARYMLDTVGHNIANANTPGYSRQRVQLSSALPLSVGNLLIGSGVDAGRVERAVDELLGRRIQSQRSLMGSLSAQLGGLSDLEALLGEPGENGLGSLLDGFFASTSKLASAPADSIHLTGLVHSTNALTTRFNDLAGTLARASSDAMADVKARVSEVNELAAEVAALNLKIGETESVNLSANDLRDRRDMALGRLSELVDTTIVNGSNGSVRVLVAGNTLVGSARANRMTITSDPAGQTALRIEGATGLVPVSGGEIGGLLRFGAELAPRYRQQLDLMAHNLILEANRVHSTGIPVRGAFHTLVGSSEIQDFDQDGRVTDELLSNAGLPFDVRSGSLYVNVVEESTGNITKHRIDISSTHTTVDDLIDELNSIEHLSAAVGTSGHLRIASDSGFGFDFSRRVDGDPDPAGTFGGARASLGTTQGEPFALADGDTLDLTVTSGGSPVTVSINFSQSDFREISAATAEEIAAAIQADPGAQARGLTAVAVDGQVFLQTQAEGSAAGFVVDGGPAAGALGWGALAGTPIQGQDNSVDVRLTGAYSGAQDDRLFFRPTQDGVIGTTDGLQVEVFDEDGNRLTTLDVGAGYVPGTELEIGNGLAVSFGLGELSATQGDAFGVDLVADSDTSDVLVALGLNSLFSGSTAADIALRDEIADDPSLLAISLSGEDGDGAVLLDLLKVEKTQAEGLDHTTIGLFWGNLVGDLGFEASMADSALASNDAVLQSLEQRQSAISGVNVDEELVDLVAYEQSFAAAAQYISVVNQLGDEVLNLI
jgi:flagellar hook-associated protein 1 FlgK